MASIKKDKNTGKWFCRVSYQDKNGKNRTKTRKGFATKKEATIVANELEIALDENIDIENKDISFADYFEKWCKTYKIGTVSFSTEEKYRYDIKLVKDYFGKKKLTSITRHDYQNFLNMRGKNNGKDIVEKTHFRLKSCLKEALHDGLIKKDPSYNAVIKYDKKPSKKVKYWNKKDFTKLINYLKTDITPNNIMLYISALTGLRIGEVYGLSWKDIKGNKLSVNRGYDYNRTFDFTNAKNESSIRTIVVTKEFNQIINQYKLKYQKKFPDYLFLQFNRPSISYNGLRKHLINVCKELEIPFINIHGLRHTHCSILIYEGMDIHYISKRLGHKSIAETIKTYSHIIDEHEQLQDSKIIEALESIESAK
ncbi:tyrosine-type recombinase/integrase [Aerococcus kribbianus]|uniref:Tyrosine-type recombinase/integrase n=1 Tax=Aerococcus kribbianus TaxID=2999064 RepID=A0A9X3FX59_9LACT|nr:MULTISPECIES: tyrosine-type recombinase/integrase [unclassified Aerococcus]MCZ0717870.1 tyrosine-type recombinase/integrase [Aerococcus sp. YH-aer221]MCZ0726157.1 tyrosine-type recombinase/integrase [Aerococcus sp. YH-aer222]